MSRCPVGDSSGCRAPSSVPGYCFVMSWGVGVPPTFHHLWGSNLLVGILLSQHPPRLLLQLFQWRARRVQQSQALKLVKWRYFFLIEIKISSFVFAPFSRSASVSGTCRGMNMRIPSILLQRSSSVCTAFGVKFVNEKAMEKLFIVLVRLLIPEGLLPKFTSVAKAEGKSYLEKGNKQDWRNTWLLIEFLSTCGLKNIKGFHKKE